MVTVLYYRQEHTALFEEQQRTIQREYDVLQDKIEKMNQQCTDNYRQATAMFADLFQSSEDGRANILGSAAKVMHDLYLDVKKMRCI